MSVCQRKAHGRGFTVVEMVVAAAVVAVLLALVILGIGGTRDAATSLVSASNMRTCAQAITAYADENDGVLPYLAVRRDFDSAFHDGFTPRGYTDQSFMWPTVLWQSLGPDPASVLFSPWTQHSDEPTVYQPGDFVGTSYRMAWACFYLDGVWANDRPAGAAESPAFLSPRRVHEVASPSGKGVLIESTAQGGDGTGTSAEHRPYRLTKDEGAGAAYTSAFFDASVGAMTPRGFERGRFLFDEQGWSRPLPVLETAGGLQGADR